MSEEKKRWVILVAASVVVALGLGALIYYQHKELERSRVEAEQLTAAINAHPSAFVAQERVACSRAPVWDERGLRSSCVAVRAYLVASGGSYSAMSGGLVRVSAWAGTPTTPVREGRPF